MKPGFPKTSCSHKKFVSRKVREEIKVRKKGWVMDMRGRMTSSWTLM